MDNRSDLTAAIKEVFSDAIYPGETTLFEPGTEGIDIPQFTAEMANDPSWIHLLDILEQSDLSKQRSLGECVMFMSPVGFHYYSPAMLIFSMNDTADDQEYSVFWRLTPRTTVPDEADLQYAYERIELYSESQMRVIAQLFAYHFSLAPDDSNLLEFWRYWRYWEK